MLNNFLTNLTNAVVQMEQERLMEVERDNRLLVSRIARTMAKGGLDNWNESYEVYSKNWSVPRIFIKHILNIM